MPIRFGSKRSNVPIADLQACINSLTVPTTLELGPGTYYGAGGPGAPLTPLTIPSTSFCTNIVGDAEFATTIASPILCQVSRIAFSRMHINPIGGDYGLKVYNGGSPFLSRVSLRDIVIGAVDKNAAIAGNGPRDGVILDGAGVFLAEKAVIAFNRRHGLVADSTGFEPNTTLKFDMCSFVQNGFGPNETEVGSGSGAQTGGYGINLQGPCSIAEFNGGNSEGNHFRELNAASMNSLRLRDFDFETSEVMADQVICGACNPIIVDNCNFITAQKVGGDPGFPGPKATRAMNFASCQGVNIKPNRYSGWTSVGIIRLDENCYNCWVDPMQLSFEGGGCWVEDYSR